MESHVEIGDAFALVYDVSNNKTFDELFYFMEKISNIKAEKVPICLLANKSDMIEEMTTETIQQREDAKQLAALIGAHFFEVSAKTGYNIRNAFSALLQNHSLRKTTKENNVQMKKVVEKKLKRRSKRTSTKIREKTCTIM